MVWTKKHDMIDKRLMKRGIYATSKNDSMANKYNKAFSEEWKKETEKEKLYRKKAIKKKQSTPFGLPKNMFRF